MTTRVIYENSEHRCVVVVYDNGQFGKITIERKDTDATGAPAWRRVDHDAMQLQEQGRVIRALMGDLDEEKKGHAATRELLDRRRVPEGNLGHSEGHRPGVVGEGLAPLGYFPVVLNALIDLFMVVADCADSRDGLGSTVIRGRILKEYDKIFKKPEVRDFYGALITFGDGVKENEG